MADIADVNRSLSAKTRNRANEEKVETKRRRAKDKNSAENTTVLGVEIGQNVEGYVSVESDAVKYTSKEDTAEVDYENAKSKKKAAKVTKEADTHPDTSEVGSGYDIKRDSDGTTVSEVKTQKQSTASLTGTTPPDESIEIVSLGGASTIELVASVKVSAERRKTLIEEIKAVANEVGTLGANSASTLNTLQRGMSVDTKEATESVLSDVSAVTKYAKESTASIASDIGIAVDDAVSSVNQVSTDIVQASLGFDDVLDDVGDAIDDVVDSIVPDIDTGFGAIQDLFEDITGNVQATLQSALSSFGAIPKSLVADITKDILEGGDLGFAKATKKLLLQDNSLSPQMKAIVASTDGSSPGDLVSKIENKANAAGLSQSEVANVKSSASNIETALSQVDQTIAGSIVSEVGDYFTEDTDLAELVKRYLRSVTESFPYVDSKEELGLEFRKVTRPISELVVHATETYTNANIGAEEIHARHNEAGHDGIQYHYVIRRDGRLQRGVPLDNQTVASDINGHAANCIDVVLVGGINVPTEADNPLLNRSFQSFTQAQMKTLEALLEVFYQHQPGGQVFGHNAIDPNSPDPYFDVISFVENKFGKKSVYEDPMSETSLSVKDMISKRAV